MVADFDRFRSELSAISNALTHVSSKTVREGELRERISTLCRTWIFIVQPQVARIARHKGHLAKLNAEVAALAALTTKRKYVSEYNKRIARAIALSGDLAIVVPGRKGVLPPSTTGDGLFIEELSDLPSRLVPNALLGWREKMREFLQVHSFDRSIFLMIRYRKNNDALISEIRKCAEKHGYKVVLARDCRITDDLYNPIACLLCCARGLAVFDKPEKQQVFNPNVAYELGMMHLLGRNCCVLKHDALRSLHTDILMKLYAPYRTVDSAIIHITSWLSST